MAEKTFATDLGSLRVQTWRGPETMSAAMRLGEELVRADERRGEFVRFDGVSAYLKGSPLVRRARRRHTLRALFLRARAPRMQEYFNLCWLHNRHFQVPLPLAAGVLSQRGAPRYQFLLTRQVEDSQLFEGALAGAPASERAEILTELGRELARMHSLGFVHRDVFPRNLLVLSGEWPRRLVFLDSWAGGEGLQRRGPAYDLACFLLEGADLLDPGEQTLFLRTYLAARTDQGKRMRPGMLSRVRREREALMRRLRRDPARLRGKPMPGPWPPNELGEVAIADAW